MSDYEFGENSGDDNYGSTDYSASALAHAAREAIEFVEPGGWGQVPQLFGFVPTHLLSQSQPEWVELLSDGAELTVIEQEPLPGDPQGGTPELDHVLATTTWPDEIVGCALVQEIIVLPPDAEADLDDAFAPLLADPHAADSAAREAAHTHPERRTARMVAAVLRDGQSVTMLQLRDDPDAGDDPFAIPELLITEEFAPNVVAALAATFDDDLG